MNVRLLSASLLVSLVATLIVVKLIQNQLTSGILDVAFNQESQSLLLSSRDDQRQLAKMDPSQESLYRQRFDEIQTHLQRMEIIEANRRRIKQRSDLLLWLVMVIVAGATAWFLLSRSKRRERRLRQLIPHLQALASGSHEIQVRKDGNDLVGRFARLIEETASGFARERQRSASLQNLKSWQEMAQRHAHELKTPLAALKLELERLVEYRDVDRAAAADSMAEELDRINQFVAAFTGFARLGKPRMEARELGPFIERFATTFATAWDGLEIRVELASRPVIAAIDIHLIKQVLVNLCSNSANARASGVQLQISTNLNHQDVGINVIDDGPGLPEIIRTHIFQPYMTTSQRGEGMGLGLAISRKIMLDHGGDLVLLFSGPSGTGFRLEFPQPEALP